jgi:hypothetical protein
LLKLEGTTIDSTVIDSVTWDGDIPDFDVESKLYVNVLKFTILTSNR